MAQEEGSMDRFNLGAYGRPISTRSAETQRWFDIGLNWCYGFNHEEGIEDQMDDLQQALDGA